MTSTYCAYWVGKLHHCVLIWSPQMKGLLPGQLSNNFRFCPLQCLYCLGISNTKQLTNWADISPYLLLQKSSIGWLPSLWNKLVI